MKKIATILVLMTAPVWADEMPQPTADPTCATHSFSVGYESLTALQAALKAKGIDPADIISREGVKIPVAEL